ncbi:hypothetical protein [Wocania ichthyoenteri]|uniref:hypothetical protein n=1 Tax=Wocania ichthyoenteri TaxID=1230531 RepID=UPI00053E8CF0|nr:hypothetical protein [Wocania ichthyoenteri]
MKKTTLLLLLYLVFTNCNNKNKASINETFNELELKKELNDSKTENDDKIDKAFKDGLFVSNNIGFDIVILGRSIFLIQDDGIDKPDSEYFFHVLQDGKELQNLDFVVKKKKVENLNKYASLLICEIKIPIEINVDKPFKVNFGKLGVNKSRLWNKYISSDKIKHETYDNRYLNKIDSKFNIFDKELENVFNYGYFIKRAEGFDLLYNDNILYFIKQNANDKDLKNRFFLHCKIKNNEKLKNLDFYFDKYKMKSTRYPNLSIAKRILPASTISFFVGQFRKDGVRTWASKYNIDDIVYNDALIYDDEYKEQ